MPGTKAEQKTSKHRWDGPVWDGSREEANLQSHRTVKEQRSN